MTDEELENEITSLRAELAETVKKAADNQAMIRDLQEILKNSKHDGEELLDKHVRNAIADLIDKSTEYRERLAQVTKERDAYKRRMEAAQDAFAEQLENNMIGSKQR